MNTTPTAQHTPTSSDVDASIAATRRVQHLTAVARDAIDDPRTLDGDTLAKAVVKALYDAHPHIRFEDALELAVIVETPPADAETVSPMSPPKELVAYIHGLGNESDDEIASSPAPPTWDEL